MSTSMPSSVLRGRQKVRPSTLGLRSLAPLTHWCRADILSPMTIVCATDFSEAAEPALLVAAALARRSADRDVWLVHVLDPDLGLELQAGEWERVKQRAESRLEAEAARVREWGDLQLVCHVVLTGAGSTSDVLAEFAAVQKASLLVVGSQ